MNPLGLRSVRLVPTGPHQGSIGPSLGSNWRLFGSHWAPLVGQTIGARWIVGGIWLRKEAHGRAKNVPKSSAEHFVFVASYKYYLCWPGVKCTQRRRGPTIENTVFSGKASYFGTKNTCFFATLLRARWSVFNGRHENFFCSNAASKCTWGP